MDYGGFRTGQCAQTCDGMPAPSDPGWKIEMDSHGCPQWTNPNDYWNGGTRSSGTSYCGGAPPRDAGLDPDGSSDASDAATD